MKRKTCLLIAFVLLFGCFSMPSVLADKEPDKNIELLNLLNITDLMPTDGENYITRGELAYVAASLGSGGAVDSETVILETGGFPMLTHRMNIPRILRRQLIWGICLAMEMVLLNH